MSLSPAQVKNGSVHLQYQQEETTLDWIKQGLLLPYNAVLGVTTLANNILEKEPEILIHDFFEGTTSYLASNAQLRWLRHGCLGLYRTPMGIWTLANKYFNPDIEIVEQRPAIQNYFESAAYYCGLNPTFPHITELYLPRSPIRYEKLQVPCTHIEVAIPLPQFPVNTFHVQSDPVLNQEILKPHRKDTFSGGSDSYLSAFELLQTIFPETQFTEDDFLLTCSPEHSKDAHKAIIHSLNGKKIDEVIKNEGEKLINLWSQYAAYGKYFDVTKEMRCFAAAVMTQVVFDTREGHEELEAAVSFMNDYLLKSALGMASASDKKKFTESCTAFRTITNKILESEKPLSIFPENFSLAKKQALCLLLFFAGMETTAFALAHNFAKLALDKSLQTQLRKDPDKIHEFVDAQLADLPPVSGLSRKLTEDAFYSFEVGNVTVQKYIRKGEKILTRLTPEYVFGKGANQCIGKVLAMKELRQSIQILLSQFELSSKDSEFRHVAKVTEQAEPFFIRVKQHYD